MEFVSGRKKKGVPHLRGHGHCSWSMGCVLEVGSQKCGCCAGGGWLNLPCYVKVSVLYVGVGSHQSFEKMGVTLLDFCDKEISSAVISVDDDELFV